MIISRIAFRNIFRQRRRSILTALTMIGGYVLLSFSFSMSEGTYGVAIELFTKSYSGHVQIHGKGYLEKPSLYNTFPETGRIDDALKNIDGITGWSYRVYSPALSFIHKKTSVARIVGIDPDAELKTSSIREKVEEGEYLPSEISNSVIIGRGLTDILKAKTGDDIVLISQGADGSIANDIFKIRGILAGGNMSSERVNIYMHVKKAQDFLGLFGRYHETVIMSDDYSKSRKLAKEISVKINDPKLDVEPWEVVQKKFYESMVADKNGMWISLFIIIIIVSLGVLNTVLMTILERTREYGIMKALGTKPRDIISLIIQETTFLAIISVFLGFVLSFIINCFFVKYGIDYPEPFDVGGIKVSTMYGVINLQCFIIPALTVVFSAMIVSIVPAIRASKIKPVDAIRMD